MTTYYFIFGGENSHPKKRGGFAYSMMDPTTLLPGVKASGRCPPLLIRDDAIVEGGVFEMALLRSLNMVHGESSKSNNKLMDFVSGREMGGWGLSCTLAHSFDRILRTARIYSPPSFL